MHQSAALQFARERDAEDFIDRFGKTSVGDDADETIAEEFYPEEIDG